MSEFAREQQPLVNATHTTAQCCGLPASVSTTQRTDQEVCTPTFWHTLFSKQLLKTRFITLTTEVLHYLLADGLVLPQGMRLKTITMEIHFVHVNS